METAAIYLAMSLSTVRNMFNIEYYVNRITTLEATVKNIGMKFSCFLELAGTTMNDDFKTICNSEYFDRNDVIDCEVII